MDRARAKELLPVIEAFANGEDVQVQRGDRTWSTFGEIGEPEFLDGVEYRIKPKPREFWLAPDSVSIEGYGNFKNLDDEPVAIVGWIKVREITDD